MDELKDLLEHLDGIKAHIEKPDELNVSSGTMCWIHPSRMCGADCTAFNAEDGLDEHGQPLDTPNKCLVLLYMGQLGSGAVSLFRKPRTSPDIKVPDPFGDKR